MDKNQEAEAWEGKQKAEAWQKAVRKLGFGVIWNGTFDNGRPTISEEFKTWKKEVESQHWARLKDLKAENCCTFTMAELRTMASDFEARAEQARRKKIIVGVEIGVFVTTCFIISAAVAML